MIIAITGASGFLGGYSAPWLAARGHRIVAVTRAAGVAAAPGIEVRRLPPAAGEEEWAAVFAGCEAVIHLAGRAHVMRESAGDPLAAYREANVETTRRALIGAALAGVGAFVYASSVKAMGEATTSPWNEDAPPAPVDPYGVSKLEAENLVREDGRRLALPTVSLRFPAMYGPGMRGNLLQLFAAVARGIPLPLGGLENRRSLLFAGNAAAALEVAARGCGRAGAVYFVSDGEDVSTPDLVRAIARALERPARLLPVPPWLFRAAGRIGDGLASVLPCPITSTRVQRLMGSLQVDSTRFRRDLGFEPPYTLAEGMRATAQWFLMHAKEMR